MRIRYLATDDRIGHPPPEGVQPVDRVGAVVLPVVARTRSQKYLSMFCKLGSNYSSSFRCVQNWRKFRKMRLGSNTPIRPSAATRNAAGGHEPQAPSQAGAAGTTTLAHNLKLGITRPPVLLLMSGCIRSSIGGPVKVKNEHSFGCAAAADPRQQQSTTDEELSTVGGNMRSGSLLPPSPLAKHSGFIGLRSIAEEPQTQQKLQQQLSLSWRHCH